MKVSLHTAQVYSNVDLAPNGVDGLVHKIGAQLGAVETVEYWGPKYDGIVVARVVSCQKHPNADKLSVCFIDDGQVVEKVERNEYGHVQVVCGAPNVRESLVVAWIPPGAVVPATFGKDPFVLEARDLRGVVSNGMLASPHELGINDDHSSILEITTQDVGEGLMKPGTEFKKLYGLDDVVIEIENKMFTHRPDCFGVLGVAREIAGIYGQAFKSPDWYLNLKSQESRVKSQEELRITVVNEAPKLVPRYMVVAMNDVAVKPSPLWMQAGLTRVGLKPINNVVDITNYLAYVTGQPLHAYDYDKILDLSGESQEPRAKNQGAVLVVRHPKPGEKIALLNGKTIEPRGEAIMIATDKELVGIGGVMGGTATEVDEKTKNIIIECANFDMYSIRRTSMAHGLFTDAVTRFNKGQSPLQNDRVIAKGMEMMSQLAGAKQASEVTDEQSQESRVKIQEVEVSVDFINQRLGLELSGENIKTLLINVEFEVEILSLDSNLLALKITAPFWRTDIEIEEDIVEEVGRLLGFDKLPQELPWRRITPTQRDSLLLLKNRLRRLLASYGSNEVLTYSFVHGKLLDRVGQRKDLAFTLSNALSPDLQYFRMSITPSLLDKVHVNVKAGHNKFALFEIGKAHIRGEQDVFEPQVPKEVNALACIIVENYKSKNNDPAIFYQARNYLMNILQSFDVADFVSTEPLKQADLYNNPWLEQMAKPYEPTRSAVLRDKTGLVWGVVGEFKASVLRALKLPDSSAGFEIDPLLCLNVSGANCYTPLSRFPSISQDICCEVDEKHPFGTIELALDKALSGAINSSGYIYECRPVDLYTSDKLAGRKRFTFRVSVTSYERTLDNEVVSKILDSVASILHQEYNVVRI